MVLCLVFKIEFITDNLGYELFYVCLLLEKFKTIYAYSFNKNGKGVLVFKIFGNEFEGRPRLS